MPIRRFLLFLLIFVQPSLTVHANEDVMARLKPAEKDFFTSRVINVIDGDTLTLENGREVRLVGLQAPKIALGRKNFKDWPLGPEAKDTLSDLTLNKHVSLFYGGETMDRYGRLLAHLFLEDGTWVQGEMLKRGMARVYSFADNRSVVEEMLALEQDAYRAKRGIWKLEYYQIRPQQESGRYTNSFQIISGTVYEVATVRGNTYLNFGEDYKTDFTIVVPTRVKRMFDQMDINLSDLAGKNIIVRGWLKYYNGPSIDLTHPEQLVIIDREN